MTLLGISAALEFATGLALIAVPQLVARLLLGAELDTGGIAVGRVAGAALLVLGMICWASRNHAGPTAQRTGLLVYNLLVGVYLGGLGLSGGAAGILLWPVVGLHVLIGLLLIPQALRNA